MTTSVSSKKNSQTSRGVLRWGMQMTSALVIFGTILFLSAGKINWLAGWIYLALNGLSQFLSVLVLIPRQPEMLAERSQVREGTKSWDRFFTPAIVVFGTLAVLITAGLDERFGWSAPITAALWGSGLALAFCSQLFVIWAMTSNPFFALTVRIQTDREHSVATSGPYNLVRHPGYLGSVVYNLSIPLILDSAWTLIPALITIGLIVARTWMEDRTLCNELSGYKEYASTVRYRLFPGVW
jgi:protein-S-isoprenylcysteine O-methyltransferase Ste14